MNYSETEIKEYFEKLQEFQRNWKTFDDIIDEILKRLNSSREEIYELCEFEIGINTIDQIWTKREKINLILPNDIISVVESYIISEPILICFKNLNLNISRFDENANNRMISCLFCFNYNFFTWFFNCYFIITFEEMQKYFYNFIEFFYIFISDYINYKKNLRENNYDLFDDFLIKYLNNGEFDFYNFLIKYSNNEEIYYSDYAFYEFYKNLTIKRFINYKTNTFCCYFLGFFNSNNNLITSFRILFYTWLENTKKFQQKIIKLENEISISNSEITALKKNEELSKVKKTQTIRTDMTIELTQHEILNERINDLEKQINDYKETLKEKDELITNLQKSLQDSKTSWDNGLIDYNKLLKEYKEKNADYIKIQLELKQTKDILNNNETSLNNAINRVKDFSNLYESEKNKNINLSSKLNDYEEHLKDKEGIFTYTLKEYTKYHLITNKLNTFYTKIILITILPIIFYTIYRFIRWNVYRINKNKKN